MLNIALPKGRLGDKVYKLFDSIGYDCREVMTDSRKLVFENKEKNVRYFMVKPSDVPVYIDKGTADIGVVGKDVLEEGDFESYELMDLKLGRCDMCVAGKRDYQEDIHRTLRVATKYPKIAKKYYLSVNRDIEIIKLNGSIEIAPISGLSDVIVDIVETGTTLKENNLKVITKIMPISARLIANRSSYRFKGDLIEGLKKQLNKKLVEDEV